MSALAARVEALAGSRPATLGSARLICIDGFSGAGKTTLAADLAARLPDALVIHVDEIVDGWGGLPSVDELVEPMLRDLAAGRRTEQPRYDFVADTYDAPRLLSPAPWVVLEGCGSGQRAWGDLTTVLVWLDVDAATGLARAVARDGEVIREPMAGWQRDERALAEREQTPARADLRWRVDQASV